MISDGTTMIEKDNQSGYWSIGRVLCAVFVALSCGAAAQAEEPKVTVELNKLEPHNDACRAYLVIKNSAGIAFDALKLDLVMFDVEGIVLRRLAVETAPLPAGKTSLKVFDMDRLPCEEVGRVLLNDVIACSDSSGTRSDCLAIIEQSSRGAVPFIK